MSGIFYGWSLLRVFFMGENFCRSNKNMTEMKKAHDKDGRSAKPKDKKKGTQK